MRTSWLVITVVVLGAGTAAHGQDSMLQKLMYRPAHPSGDKWATAYNPPAPPEPGSVVATTPPVEPPAPQTRPAPLPPSAEMPHHPASSCANGGCGRNGRCAGGGCCAGGGKGGCYQLHYGPGCDQNRLSCCERLLGWLCHHPTFCKDEKGYCCHNPPLYLYTYHECVESGRKHDVPCCAYERGLFRSILCSGHAWFSQPGGHGCCVEP
jgi:hypothetical protein